MRKMIRQPYYAARVYLLTYVMTGSADMSWDDRTNTENGQLEQEKDEHCCVLVSERFCGEGENRRFSWKCGASRP